MPKSKISKPEVKQPRVVLRSSAAEILSAYDKHIYSVEQPCRCSEYPALRSSVV